MTNEKTIKSHTASRDVLFTKTKTVLHSLEALREQHYTLLNLSIYRKMNNAMSESDQNDNKISYDPGTGEEIQCVAGNTNNYKYNYDFIQNSLQKIELGIDEVKTMSSLCCLLNQLEYEREQLTLQLAMARQDNTWLTEELATTREKLVRSEQIVVQLEVDKSHLEYMNSLNDRDSVYSLNPCMIDGSANDNLDRSLDSDHEGSLSSMSSICSSMSNCTEFDTPVRLKTLHNLVLQYASQGRYEVAVPLCHQALDDMEKTSGHEHPEFATMLNILALVYRDQGNYKIAADLLQDVLTIREKTLGCDHPAVAATLNNLAVLCGKQQKFRKAEPLCRRALEIRETVLGLNHPDVAKQLTNLALICQKQDKYDDVEILYQRALEIYEKTLGSDNPNSIKTKNILAAIYTKKRKYKSAEHLYIQLLTQLRHGACTTEHQISKEENDEPSYDHCGSWHKTMNADVPSVSSTLKNLSSLYRRQGKVDAANKLDACSLLKKEKRRRQENQNRENEENIDQVRINTGAGFNVIE